MMDFVVSYRIMEYASLHFVDHDVRNKIKRLLSSPTLGSSTSKDIEEIAFITNVKVEDHQRLRLLIDKCVNIKLIWPEVENNKDVFNKDISFDGGFLQKSLIQKNDSFDQFRKHWPFNMSEGFRKLRNALSHGKDFDTAGVVTPTLRNFELLRPWVNIITIAAGETILFKDVT